MPLNVGSVSTTTREIVVIHSFSGLRFRIQDTCNVALCGIRMLQQFDERIWIPFAHDHEKLFNEGGKTLSEAAIRYPKWQKSWDGRRSSTAGSHSAFSLRFVPTPNRLSLISRKDSRKFRLQQWREKPLVSQVTVTRINSSYRSHERQGCNLLASFGTGFTAQKPPPTRA